MALLKGKTIILYDPVQTGIDAFKAPIFKETPVDVENVLICPASTEAITDGIQVYGKHAVYELCIPKEDTHNWENRTVEFFGCKWRTFGIPLEWIQENIPLPWNRKVKVERYG